MNEFEIEYFSSISRLSKYFIDDVATVRNENINQWDDLTTEQQEELVNQLYFGNQNNDDDHNNSLIYDISSYFKINSGEKIVVDLEQEDSGWTWKDEHSGPFSWRSKSQQDLTSSDLFIETGEHVEKNKVVKTSSNRNRLLSSEKQNNNNNNLNYVNNSNNNNSSKNEVEEMFEKFGLKKTITSNENNLNKEDDNDDDDEEVPKTNYKHEVTKMKDSMKNNLKNISNDDSQSKKFYTSKDNLGFYDSDVDADLKIKYPKYADNYNEEGHNNNNNNNKNDNNNNNDNKNDNNDIKLIITNKGDSDLRLDSGKMLKFVDGTGNKIFLDNDVGESSTDVYGEVGDDGISDFKSGDDVTITQQPIKQVTILDGDVTRTTIKSGFDFLDNW